jgi:L-2-hydroxyglutarate oxidase LhgO
MADVGLKSDGRPDFLVLGGGIMGLVLSRELRARFPDCQVTLLEKEGELAQHASGRNSGVLHAGFYYGSDSLKARFTREGNRRLTAYCRDRGVPLNACGKVVVATEESELAGLDRLAERGATNGVPLEWLTEAELAEIEPKARTVDRALLSPTTSSVDPEAVMAALAKDAREAGVTLRLGEAYLGREGGVVHTTAGALQPGYVINTAGLYADRIARDFGFSANHRILPFKGLYLLHRAARGPLRTHVYPVPDLSTPFLGVHFTVTVSGRVKLGPTAIPAFWREHYRGLANFRLREVAETLGLETRMLMGNWFGFRSLARQEIPKYSRRRLAELGGKLVQGFDPRDCRIWGRPGIRAQPVNLATKQLEQDFHYEGDARSFHLINAVSPAFTCALPFGEFLVDRIEALLGHSPQGGNDPFPAPHYHG